jgi:hypothetical protein
LQKIATNNLSNGIYTVKITSDKGETKTEKLTILH